MSLYFITGSPGTGKSEVCRQLNARGYEAYDTDSAGFAQWKNLETGYIHPKSIVTTADRTPDFMKVHEEQSR